MKSRWLLVIVSLAMMGSIHAGCGGGTANEADGGGTPDGADATEEDGTTKQVILHGAVQKGPFVVGSSVQVSLLNPNLTPTGQVFNTQTINDRGEFDISFQAVGPVALEGAGYYYNEVTGQLSSSNLTLRAFFVPTQGGAQSAYINMVTHLTTERIKALVAGGTSFSAAVAQAETELRAELAITYPGFSPTISGVGMNVVGGDNDNNAYLMAVSSVFIQTAVNRTAAGGSLESNLQELLNTATFDFADGTFAGPLKQEITAALLGVDVRLVTQQFTKRLSQIGAVVAVPDMNRVLDQDRDGLPNSLDNCPITPNPGQENVKGGAYGDVCSPTWILIPAGTSMMGCVPQDPNCNGNEKPQHAVSVPAFKMTATEVTQEQYHTVVGNNPSNMPDCGGNCAEENVNWTNAKAFCEAVGGRLATEAEWEYAARAGTTTIYTCGDDPSCLASIAWFNTDATGHEVKGKAPNAFGLYDMLGNASEWVEDMEHGDYAGAPADGSAWEDATNSPFRMIRGGKSHDFDVNMLRASARSSGLNGGGAASGFRCAKSP